MKELIPFCAGLVVGAIVAVIPSRLKAIALPAVCLVVGSLASWVNGELGGSWWALFVSFDTVLVWLGALTTSVLLDRRVRALLT